MILFGIKNCDTVRKARKWLENNNYDITFHDFREDGIDEAQIQKWVELIGWEALLNKRSTSFRALSDDSKANINQQTAITLMAQQPTLIKRPVLSHNGHIITGFKAETYQAWLNK
ncbi:ArsC family reductase [Shewanella intestini]|uniref:ArsC family reductase n=1 Tax=Shewanella intestini TaxID=2017544 RepID=A0ABS5HZF1_9GAMM|nr:MULTISPECIES: ArsC family reductase [Shewanella]MBR9727122.1 ArsC family reductase [Shewanella intestini]MRG35924.1 ArsC family reductase [Shewanella sp. XMDDZSB0408]